MTLFLALALFAQTVSPVRAYTAADPVSPDRLGLATPDGRYMVVPGEGCDGLTSDMNVTIVASDEVGVLLDSGCSLMVLQRMADVPCFTNEAGECDVDAELGGR